MGLRKSDNGTLKKEIDLFDKLYTAANKYCGDPSTVNGAALVYGNFFDTAIGSWNDLIVNRGKEGNFEIFNNRLAKYDFIQHAERNLIYSLIKNNERKTPGEMMKDAIIKDFTKARMYITWTPCLECSKTIIGVGIPEIVIHEHKYTYEREDWKVNMQKAQTLLIEGGVKVRFFKHKIGVSTLFNGRIIKV